MTNTAEQHIEAAAQALTVARFGDMDASATAAIRGAADAIIWAEAHLHEVVRHARSMGTTWQEIGDVLGVTRQSAQERFSRERDAVSG